jgi:hypothetical protein
MRAAEIIAAAGLAMALLIPAARASSLFVQQESRDELDALDAFARQRPAGGLSGAPLERPGPWILYGRLGPLNFRNELEQWSSAGTRFGWSRTGPALTGRLYIGIHRRFH